MITRDELLATLLNECAIINHLYTKVPPGGFEYRPSPEQRSTLELLRYLAMCGIAPLHTMIRGDRDAGMAVAMRTATMSAEDFPEMMNRQIEEIREMFSSLSEEEMSARTTRTVRGEEISLPLAIIRMPLAWLTAYRMQLFLYLKAAGATDLSTANVWGGVDRKPEDAAHTRTDA